MSYWRSGQIKLEVGNGGGSLQAARRPTFVAHLAELADLFTGILNPSIGATAGVISPEAMREFVRKNEKTYEEAREQS